MEKIKLITDTASDVPDEDLQRYHIDMPSVPITIDGEGYFERRSFSIDQFYGVLSKSKEIPATSRVPTDDYLSCFKKAFEEGYTDVISVTINAKGSSTNASCQMAREFFYTENPVAKDKMNIHIVDSRSYCLGYGYAVITAAKMAEESKSVREILEYLEDWVARAEIYLACYSLEYAKKSGRISAAAAFVGDVLGLRPIIAMIDGTTKIVSKVRGDKNVVSQLVEHYRAVGCDPNDPVIAVYGEEKYYGDELRAALEEEVGHSVPMYRAGASIIINSGPRMAAFVCLAPKRRG